MYWYLMGFDAVARVLLVIAGALSALLLAGMIAGMIAGIVLVFGSWAFDRATTALARRWKRKGKKPKGRIGAIVMASLEDGSV